MSLRGVPDEAISLHGQGIASQSLAMTRSGKWGTYSVYDPKHHEFYTSLTAPSLYLISSGARNQPVSRH